MEAQVDAATNGQQPQISQVQHQGNLVQQPAGPRHEGVCKWFNATKGFGFITPLSPQAGVGAGEDLFVHQSNIASEGFRSLREGETVEYDTETSPDGRTKAINVTGPRGSPPQGAPPRNRIPGNSYGAGRGGMGGRRGGRGGMGMMGMMGATGTRGMAPTTAFPNPYGYPTVPTAAAMPPFYYGYYYPPSDYTGAGYTGRSRGANRMGNGRAMNSMMYPTIPGLGMGSMGLEQPSGLQVVVHNLPWACTWQQLKDCFRQWKVERADIVEDQWGRSRGFGTVRFATQEDAQMACEAQSNTQIDGRTISVRIDRFA
ncbi:hypothetical protein DUNSADRAFT_3954, partial [Dunaliella salina]